MISPDALDGVWLFQHVNRRGRRELASRAVPRSYTAGATIFRQGESARGLFVIVEGRVRVLRGPPDRQHEVHVEGPGGTLGEVPIFDGGGYPATAVAAAPTTCVVFTPDALRAAMAADPAVAWGVLHQLAARVRHLVGRLDGMLNASTAARLASALLGYREGDVVCLPGPQRELAEALGTVREVVVRELARLRRDGVIEAAGRHRFRILDEARLRALAGE